MREQTSASRTVQTSRRAILCSPFGTVLLTGCTSTYEWQPGRSPDELCGPRGTIQVGETRGRVHALMGEPDESTDSRHRFRSTYIGHHVQQGTEAVEVFWVGATERHH